MEVALSSRRGRKVACPTWKMWTEHTVMGTLVDTRKNFLTELLKTSYMPPLSEGTFALGYQGPGGAEREGLVADRG